MSDARGFGPYRLLALVGHGGMGEVWRAYDTRREHEVALKRLSARWADSPEFRERFRREAAATARVNSAHVVQIYDFGEIEGQLFLVMRLVPGGNLADALRSSRHGLGPWRAAGLTAQIASGLDAAHRRGLLHRDVKPSNVLLESDRAGEQAYLVDFGIAKMADETLSGGLTAPGDALGTPAYMAPELFIGPGRAGVASDVYALGCVLFEMLTGRRPFPADTASALMGQHLHWPAPRPSAVHPGLGPFDPVIARALAKDPARRHADAGDLGDQALAAARAVTAAPAGPAVPTAGTGAVREPTGPRPSRGRRLRAVLLCGGAAVVLVAVVLAALLLPTRDEPPTGPSPPLVPPVSTFAAPATVEQIALALTDAFGVALSPDGQRAYVADNDTDTLNVLDTATRATVARVPAGRGPGLVAVSPDSRRVYVTDYGDDANPGNTVTVVDAVTDTVVTTVPVGSEPLGIVVAADGRIYVGNNGSVAQPGTTVSVIDPVSNTVVATVPVGPAPSRLAASPDGRRVYVPITGPTQNAGNTVTVIDTATTTTSPLPAGDYAPSAVLSAPDGRQIFVVDSGGGGKLGSVQVLDLATNTVRPLTTAGVDVPVSAALGPDGRTLVLANVGTATAPAHTVAIIDTVTGALRRTDTLPGIPSEVAIAPSGNQAWVTTVQPTGLWRLPLP